MFHIIFVLKENNHYLFKKTISPLFLKQSHPIYQNLLSSHHNTPKIPYLKQFAKLQKNIQFRKIFF